MKHRLFASTAALLMVISPTIALTQTAMSQPDRQGDYYSNDAPVKGKAPSPLMAGSLWRVVAPRLNCRREASHTAAMMRQFKQGDVLQAEVYRGGADEVLRNVIDRNGKPWMPVRGKNADDRCFVRANQRYIQPSRKRSSLQSNFG